MNGNGRNFNPLLDDKYNLMSVIKHENGHQKDNSNGRIITISKHASVYLDQILDPSFINTTESFKLGIAQSLTNYILAMDLDPKINQF